MFLPSHRRRHARFTPVAFAIAIAGAHHHSCRPLFALYPDEHITNIHTIARSSPVMFLRFTPSTRPPPPATRLPPCRAGQQARLRCRRAVCRCRVMRDSSHAAVVAGRTPPPFTLTLSAPRCAAAARESAMPPRACLLPLRQRCAAAAATEVRHAAADVAAGAEAAPSALLRWFTPSFRRAMFSAV